MQLTYSTAANTEYHDWMYVDDDGANYSSYFITGYKVHGEAQRKFQSNYIVVYLTSEPTASAFIQYLWDFATSSAGHRFSTAEQAYLSRTNTSITHRRLWLRGQGLALQIKFYSQEGRPFDIIGFSMWETGNANL